MKIKIFRTISVILLIATMVAVFCLSAQTSSESSDLSEGFSFKVFSLFYPKFETFAKAKQMEIVNGTMFYVRKLAHFSLYFFMGVLSFLSFVSYKKLKFSFRVIASFFVCFIYSISDEIHQYFVPGRSCEIRDVLIDSSGAFLSIILLVVICVSVKKLKKIM